MNGQKCFELTSETKTGWQTDNAPRKKIHDTTRSRLDGLRTEQWIKRSHSFVLTWHRRRWLSLAGGIQGSLVGHGDVVHGIQVASHGLQGDVRGLHPGCQRVGQHTQPYRGKESTHAWEINSKFFILLIWNLHGSTCAHNGHETHVTADDKGVGCACSLPSRHRPMRTNAPVIRDKVMCTCWLHRAVYLD